MKLKTISNIPVLGGTLLFAALFFFWLLIYKYHLYHIEETSFFLSSGEFWRTFVKRPGGWSEYGGYFLSQFYRWAWSGALIQAAFPLLIAWFMRKISQKLFHYDGIFLSLLTAVTLFSLQCNPAFTVGYTLQYAIYFGLYSLYLHQKKVIRRWGSILLFPLILLCLPPISTLFLYFAFIVYETTISRKKDQSMISKWVWVLLPIAVCLGGIRIWQYTVYPMSGKALYILNISEGTVLINNMQYILYIFLPVCVLMAGIFFQKKRHLPKIPVYLFRISVFTICCYLAGASYNHSEELIFRMDQAVARGDWQDVIKAADRIKEKTPETLYFITLALANQGKLTEQLFEYPVKGDECLCMPRNLTYTHSLYGSELYYRLGIYNEAMHQVFEAAIATPHGMNFRTLKRLTELCILKKDSRLAGKYLSLLKQTLFYKKWAEEECKKLATETVSTPLQEANGRDFFIGGRPFLSDMARLYEIDKSNAMLPDYLLCGLLLRKDLKKFEKMLSFIYPSGQILPQLYQEALAVIARSDPHYSNRYPISEEVQQTYSGFTGILQHYGKSEQQAKEALDGYRTRFWYYLHFSK